MINLAQRKKEEEWKKARGRLITSEIGDTGASKAIGTPDVSPVKLAERAGAPTRTVNVTIYKNPETFALTAPKVAPAKSRARRDVLAYAYNLENSGDTEAAKTAQDIYASLDFYSQDKSNEYYNPYAKATSLAVQNLNALGLSTEGDWKTAYSELKNVYRESETSGAPLAPSSKSTPEQNAAYWYYKALGDDEETTKAEAELQSYYSRVSYLANDTRKNYNNDEILAIMDSEMSNYPTLKKLQDGKKTGVPAQLTRAIDWNDDTKVGMIYKARNNDESNNYSGMAVAYSLGKGKMYEQDKAVREMNDASSPNYAPHVAGATIDEDVCQQFNMTQFSKDWLEKNAGLRTSANEKERKAYEKVAKAETTTEKAEAELAALNSDIDEWIAAGKSKDEINSYLSENLADGIYPTLKKMQDGMNTGDILPLNRAVDFSDARMSAYVASKVAERDEVISKQSRYITAVGEKHGIDFVNGDDLTKNSEKLARQNAAALGLSGEAADDILYATPSFAAYREIYAKDFGSDDPMARQQSEAAFSLAFENFFNGGAAEYLSARSAIEKSEKDKADWAKQLAALEARKSGGAQSFYDKYNIAQKDATGAIAFIESKTDEAEREALIAEFDAYRENEDNYQQTDPEQLEREIADVRGKIAQIDSDIQANKALMSGNLGKFNTVTGAIGETGNIESVLDALYSFKEYLPTDWSGGNLYSELKAYGIADSYQMASTIIGDEKKTLQSLKTLAKSKGMSEYAANIDRRIAELDRNLEGAEYAMLAENADYAETVQAYKEGDHSKDTYGYFMDLVDSGKKFVPAGDASYDVPYEYASLMTQDERDTYRYLYAKSGAEAANEYWDYLTNDSYGALNYRASEQLQEETAEFAKSSPILATTLTSVGNALLGSMGAIYSGIKGALGEEINPYSPAFATTTMSNTVKQTVKDYYIEAIQDPTQKAFFGFFYDMYSTVIESGASALAGNTLGSSALGTGMMASMAGAAATQSAKFSGASDGQALLRGVSSTAIEFATEYIPMDNILRMADGGVDGVRGFFKALGKQVMEEAPGEMLSEIGDTITDNMIMGELSQMNQSIENYIDSGYSPEEAKRQATLDCLGNVLYAGLLGGMAALPTTAVSYSVGAASDSARTKKIVAGLESAKGKQTSNLNATAAISAALDGGAESMLAARTLIKRYGNTKTAESLQRFALASNAFAADAKVKAAINFASAMENTASGRMLNSLISGDIEITDEHIGWLVSAAAQDTDSSASGEANKAKYAKVLNGDFITGSQSRAIANADLSAVKAANDKAQKDKQDRAKAEAVANEKAKAAEEAANQVAEANKATQENPTPENIKAESAAIDAASEASAESKAATADYDNAKAQEQASAKAADEAAESVILSAEQTAAEESTDPASALEIDQTAKNVFSILQEARQAVSLPVSEINIDPATYQFKGDTDENGIVSPIASEFVPAYMGDLIVHKRADGKYYVADGHHRLDLAKRSGQEAVNAIVYDETDGYTAADVRTFAAMRNLSQNHGTAIDAAKVFREMGIAQDQLAKYGVSANNRAAADGEALASLNNEYFARVTTGNIPESVGVLMGSTFGNDEQKQRRFMQLISGKELSQGALTELSSLVANAETTQAEQTSLFGDMEQTDNILEMAEVVAATRRKITGEKNIFTSLSNEKKADKVESVGENKLDTDANRRTAENANAALMALDTYSQAGIVHDLVSQAADRLMNGEFKNAAQAAAGVYNTIKGLIDNGTLDKYGREANESPVLSEKAVQAFVAKSGENKIEYGTNVKRAVKAPSQIAKELADVLHIGFNNGTRKLNFSTMPIVPRGSMGYYKRHYQYINIRGKAANDFTVTMHELGHALAHRVNMRGTDEMVANLDGTRLDLRAYSQDSLYDEAFAEFFASYVRGNQYAEKFADAEYVTQFENALAQQDLLEAVKQTQRDIGEYVSASAESRAQAIVRLGGKKSSFKEWIKEIARKKIDATIPINDIMGKVKAQTASDGADVHGGVMDADNLRNYAQWRNFANERASLILEEELVAPDGTRTGIGSLSSVFEEAGINFDPKNGQEYDQFITYWLYLHSFDWDAQGRAVYESSITRENREDYVARMDTEHPEYRKAVEGFQKWMNSFAQFWLIDSGRLTDSAWADMQARNPAYCPLTRELDGKRAVSGSGKGGFRIRRGKGSTLDIHDPIDSIVSMVNRIVNQGMQDMTLRELYRINETYEGIGEFMSDITEDVIVHRKNVTDLKERMTTLLNGSFLDTPETDNQGEAIDHVQKALNLIDEASVQLITQHFKDSDNVVQILTEDGQTHFFKVHDRSMYEALTNVSHDTRGKLLKLLGNLTRATSALATSFNVIFSGKNVMRDVQQSVKSGSWANNYLSGFIKWCGILSEVRKENGEFKDYKAMGGGGFNYIYAGTQKSADGYRRLLFKGYGKGKAVIDKIGKAITFERFAEILEQTSRYAEYKYGKYDKSTSAGKLAAFIGAQNATVNFHNKGVDSTKERSVVPFFNAAVQGAYKQYRMLSGEMGKAERSKYLAKTAMNAAIMPVLAALSRALFMPEEEKEAMAALEGSTRAKYYIFSLPIIGTVRIPVDQDMLSMAGSFFGNELMDGTTNPDGFGADLLSAFGGILTDLLPSTTVFAPFLDIARNRTWYGSELESAYMKTLPAESRYNDSTSDLAKWLGRVLGVSPIILDYIGKQTGVIGNVAAPLVYGAINGGIGGLASAGGKTLKSAFGFDPLTQNSAISNFYNGKDAIEQIATVSSDKPADYLRKGMSQKEATKAKAEAIKLGKRLDSQSRRISELTERINAISESDDYTDSDRAALLREAKAERLQLAAEGNNLVSEYNSKYVNDTIGSFFAGIGVSNPTPNVTAYDTLADTFLADENERYMKEAKKEYERIKAETGDEAKAKAALPIPQSQAEIDGVTHYIEAEMGDEYQTYLDEYKRVYKDNFDRLGASKAAAQAKKAAKDFFLEWLKNR